MKKIFYRASVIGALCLPVSLATLAQLASPPPPPPPAKAEAADKIDRREIVIRQKGDKDTKLTLEIKNGEYFINGKPLDKFEDNEVVIEKRDIDEDLVIMPDMAFSPSPFRMSPDEQRRMELDIDKAQREAHREMNSADIQRQIQKAMKIRSNAAFLGISSKKNEKGGATVLEVTKGSPAEKAGIRTGDIITKINEAGISSPEDLFETIHNFKAGDKVKVTYLRGGKSSVTTATLEKAKDAIGFNYNYNYKMSPMPPMPPMPDMDGIGMWGNPPPKLGIKAQDAEDGKGVNVLEVEDSSAAAKAGVKKGDVILQFDGTEVNDTHELIEQIQEARKKNIVKLKILRGTATQEIELKIPRKLKTAEL